MNFQTLIATADWNMIVHMLIGFAAAVAVNYVRPDLLPRKKDASAPFVPAASAMPAPAASPGQPHPVLAALGEAQQAQNQEMVARVVAAIKAPKT